MTIRRHGEKQDEGAILVLALIIITTVALVTGALLFRNDSNFRATVVLRHVAGMTYAADAAAKTAIYDLEQGSSSSDVTNPPVTPWVYQNLTIDGAGCFGITSGGAPDNSLELKNLYPPSGRDTTYTSARVECSAVPGTGGFGTGSGDDINPNNTLPNAITILGGTAGDQMSVGAKGADFLIRGNIEANAATTVTRGQLITDGHLYATSCTNPAAITSPDTNCSEASGFTTDPAIPPPVTTYDPAVLPLQTNLSGCTFQPGYYDDSSALSSAVNACNPAVFAPGLYYFDFHDDATDAMNSSAVMPQDSANTWSINTTVVGGTQSGSSSVPGSCLSPYASPSNTSSGVEFLFGGSSRIYLDQGAVVELCGNYSKTSVPTVLYGLKTGATAAAQTPTLTASTVSGTASPGSTPAFTAGTVTAANLASVDGTSANWVASTAMGSSSSATLTLSSFALPSIPVGSVVTSAKLKVTHQETGTNTSNLSAKVTSGSTSQTATVSTSPTMTTQSIDVTNTVAALVKAIHDGTSTAASAPAVVISTSTSVGNHQVTTNAMTLNVDAVQLELTYIPPALRGETNSSVTTGNTNCLLSTACAFLSTKTSGNPKVTFVVNGVSYVPLASLLVNLSNQTGQTVEFTGGIVARSLTASGWPQYSFTGPFASIPVSGPGEGPVTAVDLRVYLCVAQATCASGGTLALTSRVRLTDVQDPVTKQVTATPGQRHVDILSWAEQR